MSVFLHIQLKRSRDFAPCLFRLRFGSPLFRTWKRIEQSSAVANVGVGAIPPGTYYIVDRHSGRFFGWILDDFGPMFGTTDRRKWFMLWNPLTGDATMVHGVKRGLFRLHPDGPHHESDGCITLKSGADFERLRDYLKAKGATMPIPGTDMKAYGRVDVR